MLVCARELICSIFGEVEVHEGLKVMGLFTLFIVLWMSIKLVSGEGVDAISAKIDGIFLRNLAADISEIVLHLIFSYKRNDAVNVR